MQQNFYLSKTFGHRKRFIIHLQKIQVIRTFKSGDLSFETYVYIQF